MNLPWFEARGKQIEKIVRDFHAAHQLRYGHNLDEPVELVNLRVSVSGKPPSVVLSTLATGRDARPAQHARLFGVNKEVSVFTRDCLVAGQRIVGPALITETVATTYIEPGWNAEVEAHGNLLLRIGGLNLDSSVDRYDIPLSH